MALKILTNQDLYISLVKQETLIRQADDVNTPPETLDRLADSGLVDVRYRVARNLNTLPETLSRMAKYDAGGVRYEVAQNPNTPPETLARLANDVFFHVRNHVAQNPNTPSHIKEYLNAIEFMRVVCYES